MTTNFCAIWYFIIIIYFSQLLKSFVIHSLIFFIVEFTELKNQNSTTTEAIKKIFITSAMNPGTNTDL